MHANPTPRVTHVPILLILYSPHISARANPVQTLQNSRSEQSRAFQRMRRRAHTIILYSPRVSARARHTNP